MNLDPLQPKLKIFVISIFKSLGDSHYTFSTQMHRDFYQLLSTINYQGGELLSNFKINAKTYIN